jgi:succinoglycan biosynthesis transport protein ExoP
VIDGNFVQPHITQITNAKYLLEDYLKNNIELTELNNTGPFSVLGMKGGYASLFEIYNENVLQQKMQELKLVYDIILIEAPALVHLNKSKEWLLFCDKIAAVFRANQTIDPEKDQFVNYLKSRNQQFMGWVLTQTTEKN